MNQQFMNPREWGNTEKSSESQIDLRQDQYFFLMYVCMHKLQSSKQQKPICKSASDWTQTNHLMILWSNPTCFSGERHEGVYPLFTIASFRGYCRDIVPAHGFDNIHHGLCLETVWRNDSGKEVIAAVVAQLRGGGCIADLRNLEWKTREGVIRRKEVKWREDSYGNNQFLSWWRTYLKKN